VELKKEEEVGALQTHITIFKKPIVILFFSGYSAMWALSKE
jgi:hypothetical protein